MSGLRQQRRRVHELTSGSYSVLDWSFFLVQRKNAVAKTKLLRKIVGAWGFEPQTLTVPAFSEMLNNPLFTLRKVSKTDLEPPLHKILQVIVHRNAP